MKKLSMMIMAACLLLLASCSLKPKSIAPTSTKFDGGKLATLVELVGTEGELSFEETEAAVPAQIIRLKAKLKLNEETAYLQTTDLKEIEFSYEPLKVTLQDAEGKEVKELELSEDDYKKLAKHLQGKKGEEVEVTFEATYHNSKEAPNWFKQSVAFAAGDAGDVYPIVYNMDGEIGKYPIHVTLVEQKDGMIRGAYYYKRGSSTLYLVGERNGKFAELNEYVIDGTHSGYWEGALSELEYSGAFEALAYGKSYTFLITPTTELEPIKFDGINFDKFWYMRRYEPVESAGVSESGDLSELLDKYEKYVDDYIALLKKANDGDITALTDAAQLMEDAQELAEELEKEQGNMSVADAKRLAEINEKMIIAAENMQGI